MADPENPTTQSCGRTIWNDKTRSDLLIAVMDNCNPTDDQVERIMSKVAAQGYVYNWSAAKQHIQKLKRKEGGGTTPAGTPAATPASKGGRKRKVDTPGPDVGTPTKKRGRKPKAKKDDAESESEADAKVKAGDIDGDLQDGDDDEDQEA